MGEEEGGKGEREWLVSCLLMCAAQLGNDVWKEGQETQPRAEKKKKHNLALRAAFLPVLSKVIPVDKGVALA